MRATPSQIGLNNAAKYTDRAGRISLTAALRGEAERSWLEVRVRDNGIGIGPELLPRVFDLFVQGDCSAARTQGGLGIGLTLVKRLVEMHNGTVAAHSEGPGQGSEFVVSLPALPAPLRPSAPTLRPLAAGRGWRVLVVDDNVDAAESLSVLLRADGYEVRTASSGSDALGEASAFRPDAVLLDIGLPGMDGYETARRLRERPETRGAVLIALTGYGQDEDRRRSREAGFDHHRVKPAGFAELRALLAPAR